MGAEFYSNWVLVIVGKLALVAFLALFAWFIWKKVFCRPLRIFLICPVRGVSEEKEGPILEYVTSLRTQGKIVYYPKEDTIQVDPEGGIRILWDNTWANLEADEVHVWWDESSKGSLYDIGVTMAAAAMGQIRKVVLANPEAVQSTEGKSFQNALLALARDPKPKPNRKK